MADIEEQEKFAVVSKFFLPILCRLWHFFLMCWVRYKAHIEKIDFQELIFAVIIWPNSEVYGAIVCIIRYFGYNPTG